MSDLLFEIKKYNHHDGINFYYLGLEFFVPKKYLTDEVVASYVSLMREHIERTLW